MVGDVEEAEVELGLRIWINWFKLEVRPREGVEYPSRYVTNCPLKLRSYGIMR